jgi:hypothetical protein
LPLSDAHTSELTAALSLLPTRSLSRRDEEHKDNWDKGLSEEELQRAKDQEADRALRQEEDDKGAIMKRMQPNKNKPTDEVRGGRPACSDSQPRWRS